MKPSPLLAGSIDCLFIDFCPRFNSYNRDRDEYAPADDESDIDNFIVDEEEEDSSQVAEEDEVDDDEGDHSSHNEVHCGCFFCEAFESILFSKKMLISLKLIPIKCSRRRNRQQSAATQIPTGACLSRKRFIIRIEL